MIEKAGANGLRTNQHEQKPEARSQKQMACLELSEWRQDHFRTRDCSCAPSTQQTSLCFFNFCALKQEYLVRAAAGGSGGSGGSGESCQDKWSFAKSPFQSMGQLISHSRQRVRLSYPTWRSLHVARLCAFLGS
jgi:hypothetical protein